MWTRRRDDNLEKSNCGISTEGVFQGVLNEDQKVPQKVILIHGLYM